MKKNLLVYLADGIWQSFWTHDNVSIAIQTFENTKIFSWYYNMPLFATICDTVETVVNSKYQAMSNDALISLIAYDSV